MAWRLVQFVMIVLTSFTPTSLHSASLLTQIQIQFKYDSKDIFISALSFLRDIMFESSCSQQ